MLKAVSCPTAAFCVAVDDRGDAVRFRGGSWAAAVAIDAGNVLASVSCPSVSFCVAVDNQGNVLSYNGSSCGAATSIDAGHVVHAVSCPSAAFCIAVDDRGDAVRFSGGSWSAAVAIDAGNVLESVSCPSPSFCVAVDDHGHAVTYSAGSWSALAPADPANLLDSVSCPSTSFCAALDDHSVNGLAGGDGVTFDGISWSTPVPLGSTGLVAVSCPSASFCAAVDGSGRALTYDGSSWSGPVSIDSAHPPLAISCSSAAFCVAIDAANALIDSGGSWSAPVSIDSGHTLRSVSCPSALFCVAVADGVAVTFDGSAWSAPTTIDSYPYTPSVSCPSSAFCAVVDGGARAVTYDGSSWSARGVTGLDADSVSCSSAAFCAAVHGGFVATFVGSSWSLPVQIDSAGLESTGLTSVSCPSGGFCVAVDDQGNALTYVATVPPPPVSSSPPMISGSAIEGQTLTEAHGAWSNNPVVYAHQWETCDSSGSTCAAIAGARGQTYTLTSADVGHTIRVKETAVNAGGNGSPAVSGQTAVVLVAPPSSISPPAISGSTTQGQTLTEAHGLWTNSPTGYAYQWEDCDSAGNACSAIAGATAPTHTLTSSDVGHTIRVQEVASNATGAGVGASSAPTAVVSAASSGGGPPGAGGPPKVTGYRITNNPFAVSAARTPIVARAAAKKHGRGTAFKYRLSEPATARIVISARLSGRRQGRRCLTPTKRLRRARACTRIVARGTLARSSHRGADTVAFSGRIGSKALKPGHYQATLTATDAAKHSSKPQTVRCTIVLR